MTSFSRNARSEGEARYRKMLEQAPSFIWKRFADGVSLRMRMFAPKGHRPEHFAPAVLFFCGVACLFASADYSYTEITSPASVGESHELLFEEKSYFMGGVGTVYEKVSPCFMKKLGDYVLDDGITYVHDGYCHFEWREDGFTLHYETEAEFEYLQE